MIRILIAGLIFTFLNSHHPAIASSDDIKCDVLKTRSFATLSTGEGSASLLLKDLETKGFDAKHTQEVANKELDWWLDRAIKYAQLYHYLCQK